MAQPAPCFLRLGSCFALATVVAGNLTGCVTSCQPPGSVALFPKAEAGGSDALHSSSPPPKSVWITGVAPDPDNTQKWHPRAFMVGGKRFGTLEEFKAFIVTLPPGSVVNWNSGCIGYHLVPLAHSDMTMVEFTAFCKNHEVKFEHVVPGYQP